jgi:heme-degrading monooxygenase HmoA
MNNHNRYYLVVWEFQVKLEAQFAFEQIYGPAGGWARLFCQSPNYRGTLLLRDVDQPGRYLTFDYWTSREALHEFKQAHQADYDAFDKQCESLADNESLLGEFESLSASPTAQPVARECL